MSSHDAPFASCTRACHCDSPPRAAQATCPCGVKIEARVTFERTTDAYWFDWLDRRKPKCTLEDGIAHDDALKQGDTTLSLRAWLREHRAG